MLGLAEVEGADDCEGLKDCVGFSDGTFDGALLMLGLLEPDGACDCREGKLLELGRLDCDGSCDTEGFTLGTPEGALEWDGLDDSVGSPAVFSTYTLAVDAESTCNKFSYNLPEAIASFNDSS